MAKPFVGDFGLFMQLTPSEVVSYHIWNRFEVIT